MGVSRESDNQQIDVVKEMAEALGSQGLKLEETLEHVQIVRRHLDQLLGARDNPGRGEPTSDRSLVNQCIMEYNKLIGKAEDALHWLLIQREACGFRTHRDVSRYYPIPPRIKPLKS